MRTSSSWNIRSALIGTVGLTATLVVSVPCHAETLSPQAFHYSGGPISSVDRNDLYAAWNANDPRSVLRPGFKVLFFGSPEGCSSEAANGPVSNRGNPLFDQAAELTGIPLASNPTYRWSPSGQTDQCDSRVRGAVGSSFIHLNPDADGGIGLFTATGKDRTGREIFFHQFGASGRKGANAFIEGSFAAFRFDWQKGATVTPWQDEKSTAEIRTVQTVASVSTGNSPVTTKEPVQAKQQLIVSFINNACMEHHAPGQSCQIQYLFNIAVYRAGVSDWSREAWFRSPGVFFDPAQGGMPVMHGPIPESGQTAIDAKTGIALYTSAGEGTQHGIFRDKTFRMRISFDQFKGALREAASEKRGGGNVASVFGEKWDSPSEWRVVSVNVSQEVHNPLMDLHAYIGGNTREIYIGSAQ